VSFMKCARNNHPGGLQHSLGFKPQQIYKIDMYVAINWPRRKTNLCWSKNRHHKLPDCLRPDFLVRRGVT
jgi:hypothetical protein